MKVAFHTLGCKVNQYESEALAKKYRDAGHEIVGERDFADVYVINTCTVTGIADRKSRQYIRRMKKVNPDAEIIVTGCYAAISPDEVSAIEGIDRIMTMEEKRNAVSEVSPVASTEGRTRAYIKVQEGCNRFCSYCVIPYARGPVISRPVEEIVEEAKALIDSGYKEIVLTGINTALYDGGIEPVIAAVNELPGEFRIRLSSLEPTVVNAEYVKKLFNYNKLCHHLHMSAQSGSDSILASMNRHYTSEDYIELAKTVCSFDPCYGLSTDIIVGFPGERDEDFRDTCRLVARCAFCKTHIFRYSKRPLTKAAEMDGQISPGIKDKRASELQSIANRSAKAFFDMNLEQAMRGRTERVLIEEKTPDGKYMTGYSGNYIKTYIPVGKGVDESLINTFVETKFTGIYNEGMTAELLK